MAETHEELPPKYSQVPENHAPTASAAVETAPPAITTGAIAIHKTGDCEGRQSIVKHCAVESGGGQNTTEYHIMGKYNASNSFSGFIDILYENKKLPWSCGMRLIYKLGLFAYYLGNVVHSITAAITQEEHLAFYVTYILISSVGLAVETVVTGVHVIRLCIRDDNTGEEEKGLLNSTGVHIDKLPLERIKRVQEYPRKARRVIVDYILSSLGEFLIPLTLLCTLYGFINETAWEFDDTISVFNIAFLLYSVVMQFLYMNVYVFILVVRVALAVYVKYDKLLPSTEMEWKKYFTPVYLTRSFAFLTALTHWFMIGIIGVRVYVDNFTPDQDDTGSMGIYADNVTLDDTNDTIPDAGDYKVTLFTRYMIACTLYLPIVSWITYIILNKSWFFEVYSAINQMASGADHMPPKHTWDKKLFDFKKDPLAYIAVVFLMLSFVAFTAGAYLVDYGSTDYEVASSARNTIQELGIYFIICFVLSNLQAVIIFVVLLVAIIVAILGCLPLVCVGVCYMCYNIDKNIK